MKNQQPQRQKQSCPRPHFRPVPPVRRSGFRTVSRLALGMLLAVLTVARGAGMLQPADAGHQPIRITDHAVQVVINNGFAITTVTQTFDNPNPAPLEAIYSFPLPKSASLSEVRILLGENVINGEVLAKNHAEQVYEEEKQAGNDAGLASREGYRHLRFKVAPVRPGVPVVITFVYYQSLTLDTEVGRYVYPLEEGGTDEPAALSFWSQNDQVEGTFSFAVELKSAWPVADVRLPGLEGAATVERLAEGHWRARLDQANMGLNRDLVFYYRLANNLPGRVELVTYRPAPDKAGTFMLVVTPGIDLKPLDRGADYVFVLDTSGSMSGKLGVLAEGVARTLGEMRPQDRFRVIQFNSQASAVTSSTWHAATPAAVQDAIARVKGLQSQGGTNLYDGIALALKDLDDDRATSIVLVTDGVTNTGNINPKAFHELLKQYDVRVFGFLMGNSANWPLMQVICDASGGFYASVSNADDIIGQIMLAKSKVLHECLHDATLKVQGVRVRDTTDGAFGKVYRGQQLVFLGRYDRPGRATVELRARLTGEDKVYSASFDFPAVDTANPELERLWALDRIEALERQRDVGLLPVEESATAIRDLGITYQLVTEETSMVVLSDERFASRGIERRNRERVATERVAQSQRAVQPAASRQVDAEKPAFQHRAPSIGGGGGALDPLSVLGMLALAGLMCCRRSSRKRR